MAEEFVIGIDVGTGSVRAALIDKTGNFKKVATQNIQIWNPQPEFFEQSSEDIWNACCTVIKEVSKGVKAESVKGLGFDATCSLVAVDCHGEPVTVSLTGEKSHNVIMWMDHRAAKQAEFINNSGHNLLKFVGGKVSLEMQVPKLLWLKNNLKECWNAANKFFDLPDFLTWKATGCDSRSLCSVVCKWMFEASSAETKKWNREFYISIGLKDLLNNDCEKIGRTIKTPGESCGEGLCDEVAQKLDLLTGTAVATSIIDAHAGGLGLLGCLAPGIPQDLTQRLAMICGTSTCHMKLSEKMTFVNGIWGPYYSAMVSGLWLNEAGQSAAGKLLDHIIDSHPASKNLKAKLGSSHIANYLNNLVEQIASKQEITVDCLTKNLHIWPDFHGNRSPVADSSLKGMISGLDLSTNEEQLALIYLATIQALAYGTRHIIEVLQENGHKEINCILMCGGLSKNDLFVQTQANVVSRAVLIPKQSESVLLGSAILAATASKMYSNVQVAMSQMSGSANHIKPNQEVTGYHERKYKVFKKMLQDQLSYRFIMRE